MTFDNFTTWEVLATYGGAVLMTTLITQGVKEIKYLANVSTRLVSYVVALVVLLLATYFTGGLTVSDAVLILFNAYIVATSANGTFDGAVRFIGEP